MSKTWCRIWTARVNLNSAKGIRSFQSRVAYPVINKAQSAATSKGASLSFLTPCLKDLTMIVQSNRSMIWTCLLRIEVCKMMKVHSIFRRFRVIRLLSKKGKLLRMLWVQKPRMSLIWDPGIFHFTWGQEHRTSLETIFLKMSKSLINSMKLIKLCFCQSLNSILKLKSKIRKKLNNRPHRSEFLTKKSWKNGTISELAGTK